MKCICTYRILFPKRFGDSLEFAVGGVVLVEMREVTMNAIYGVDGSSHVR